MSSYQVRIVASWVLLLLAAIVWIALIPDFIVWKIIALLAIAPRINSREKARLTELGKKPGILTIISFIYMLGWLAYILVVYFQNSENTEAILDTKQFVMFVAPIFFIFIIADIKWYFRCNYESRI